MVTDDNVARLWDTATGRMLAVLRGHEATVWPVVFAPDGQRLATASHDGTARIWDAVTGRTLAVLRGHKGGVICVAFAPDGRRLATGGSDGTARLWDATSGRMLNVIKAHQNTIWAVAFAPDGRQLATASHDGTARIWDVADGRELAVLHGNEGSVDCVAFAPDGQRLATCGSDGTARLWDAAIGRELAVLRGHKQYINWVAFASDGRRLATASYDGTARLWDTATGRELHVFRGHQDKVVSVVFALDGLRLATASHDGSARLWDASPVTDETRDRRDALSLVRFLLERAGSEGALRDGITRDRTISEAVRSLALEQAGPFWKSQVHARAERVVEPLMLNGLLRDEVLAALRENTSLDAEVRADALAQAADWPPAVGPLHQKSHDVACRPGFDPAAYRDAVRRAEAASRNDASPLYPWFAATLGMAQYRAGLYGEARATLQRALSRMDDQHRYADVMATALAFLAMDQQRLGDIEEARATLERLRAWREATPSSRTLESGNALLEAEALILGLPSELPDNVFEGPSR
jgi:hypothetical protein